VSWLIVLFRIPDTTVPACAGTVVVSESAAVYLSMDRRLIFKRPYFFLAAFFLVAFFLVAFFAFAAMINSPCRVSPGRSIYRIQK
jgi:hypothetical protein